MRCKPLVNFDRIQQRHRITERMKRWKYKFLGAGYYSAVFQHPRQAHLVIKYGPLDDGWLVFAAWCEAQRSSGNSHLPVIHSIKRYEKHGIYCAIMEKLDNTVSDEQRLNPDFLKGGWGLVRGRFNYGVAEYGDASGWSEVTLEAWTEWLTVNGMSQVFEDTLARLRKFAVKHGLGRDLHAANAMVRKRPDGTFDLVLTDPFSEGNGCDLNKALQDVIAA